MVRQTLAGRVVVGKHVSAPSRVLGHEPLQGDGFPRPIF